MPTFTERPEVPLVLFQEGSLGTVKATFFIKDAELERQLIEANSDKLFSALREAVEEVMPEVPLRHVPPPSGNTPSLGQKVATVELDKVEEGGLTGTVHSYEFPADGNSNFETVKMRDGMRLMEFVVNQGDNLFQPR